jgi:hypothetical protein
MELLNYSHFVEFEGQVGVFVELYVWHIGIVLCDCLLRNSAQVMAAATATFNDSGAAPTAGYGGMKILFVTSFSIPGEMPRPSLPITMTASGWSVAP